MSDLTETALLASPAHRATGIPCKRGHVGIRYSDHSCVECRRSQRPKVDPDRKRELDRARYAANPEKFRERQKDYRRADPEKNLAVKRSWLDRNSDYYRDWSRNNRDAIASYKAVRRSRKVSGGGFFTAADVARIRMLQKDCCGYCRVGLNGKGDVDHIVPLARGGSNWPRNLQLLCAPCNQRKKDRDPLEFVRSMGRLI